MTPLLFMGQEWAASTPFQFFTDFGPDLGRLVTEGRRREFRSFPEFADPDAAAQLRTRRRRRRSQRARLRWIEHDGPEHAAEPCAPSSAAAVADAPIRRFSASDAPRRGGRARIRDTILVTRHDPDGSSRLRDLRSAAGIWNGRV